MSDSDWFVMIPPGCSLEVPVGRDRIYDVWNRGTRPVYLNRFSGLISAQEITSLCPESEVLVGLRGNRKGSK